MSVINDLHTSVTAIIAGVLALEPEEVTANQNFFNDLGGESIDVLDLQFQVEKQLGVKVRFEEMVPSTSLALDDQGRLTPDVRARLSEEYPFLRPGLDECQSPRDLMTVGNIVEFVACAQQRSATAA